MHCIPTNKINAYEVVFAYAFDEFWKLNFAFDEHEFSAASSQHYLEILLLIHNNGQYCPFLLIHLTQ